MIPLTIGTLPLCQDAAVRAPRAMAGVERTAPPLSFVVNLCIETIWINKCRVRQWGRKGKEWEGMGGVGGKEREGIQYCVQTRMVLTFTIAVHSVPYPRITPTQTYNYAYAEVGASVKCLEKNFYLLGLLFM